ncbi:YdcF family protein [Pandoraea sp. PE-S2T-3]|uniref:YdcF family protein n=1 Tax=Pandoraea sp. PE-S2T-3 TaxID=1986993 RepID=UPI000B3F6D69
MPSIESQQLYPIGNRHLDSLPESIRLAAETVWAFLHIGCPLQSSADYIVGLGSYDPRVSTYCATLLLDGWAPAIIFSGSSGNWTRNVWHDSEAQIFSGHAIAAGVPKCKIVTEDKSTNVGENIVFTKRLLAREHRAPKSVILVTKPTSERRVLETARYAWPEVAIAVSSPRLSFREQFVGSPRPEILLDEMTGEIHRLIEYPNRDYFSIQSIPPNVMHAYEHLLDSGFTNHLSI